MHVCVLCEGSLAKAEGELVVTYSQSVQISAQRDTIPQVVNQIGATPFTLDYVGAACVSITVVQRLIRPKVKAADGSDTRFDRAILVSEIEPNVRQTNQSQQRARCRCFVQTA